VEKNFRVSGEYIRATNLASDILRDAEKLIAISANLEKQEAFLLSDDVTIPFRRLEALCENLRKRYYETIEKKV
jgi:hypothetical protein